MTALFPDQTRGAVLSACGLYRYRLTRTWGDGPPVVFVMLNPSTADAERDDPTIRKCRSFARAWGHGGLVVVNLFAYRATNPKRLRQVSAPVGPDNDGEICQQALGRRVIAAWGMHGILLDRAAHVMRLLASLGSDVYCLGTTKDGYPRHPLYMANETTPVRFAG